MSNPPRMPRLLFHESRHVPWWWYLAAICLTLPTTEAIVVLGPEMSNHLTAGFTAISLAVTAAVVAGLLVLLGHSNVDVSPAKLRAGRAELGAGQVGRVRALDPAQARLLLGPGLRADAWLSLRPWIKTAVQIEVIGDDSTPYWVVATRHPVELMTALSLIRRQRAGQEPARQESTGQEVAADAFAHRETEL